MTNYDRERGNPNQEEVPKPYDFVPLARSVKRGPPTGHDRYRHHPGRLEATLIARSPVHVASGLLEQKKDGKYPLVKAHFRSNGKVVIPATSLKGCVRSVAEAISQSAAMSKARHLPSDMKPSTNPEKLDVAQRIFGAQGYQGQVRFTDAELQGNSIEIVPTPPLYQPDTRYAGYRVPRRKFYMHGKLAEGTVPLEACSVESRFTFKLDFANMTDGELGLLLLALGLGKPKLWLKLGGAKPACLGTLETVEPHLEIWQTHGEQHIYHNFEVASVSQTDIQSFLDAASTEGLVLEEQLKRLAGVLRWPRDDRDCPGGVY
jgi:hypothetical protein